jgi:hypothetical protein
VKVPGDDDVLIIGGDDAGPANPALATDASTAEADGVAVIADEEDGDKKLPARAIKRDDGSIELPLHVPVVLKWKKGANGIVVEDPPIDRLVMRRLTGKDVRQVMSAAGSDNFFPLLTGMCVKADFPQHKWTSIFDRMDGSDTAAAISIAQHFLEHGPTPGR